MFVFAHLDCEDAFGQKTSQFDIKRCASQIKSIVNYYVQQGFPDAFAKDTDNNGVTESVHRIINLGLDSRQIVDTLKNT